MSWIIISFPVIKSVMSLGLRTEAFRLKLDNFITYLILNRVSGVCGEQDHVHLSLRLSDPGEQLAGVNDLLRPRQSLKPRGDGLNRVIDAQRDGDGPLRGHGDTSDVRAGVEQREQRHGKSARDGQGPAAKYLLRETVPADERVCTSDNILYWIEINTWCRHRLPWRGEIYLALEGAKLLTCS